MSTVIGATYNMFRLKDDLTVGERVGITRSVVSDELIAELSGRILFPLFISQGDCTVIPVDDMNGRAYMLDYSMIETVEREKVFSAEESFSLGEIVSFYDYKDSPRRLDFECDDPLWGHDSRSELIGVITHVSNGDCDAIASYGRVPSRTYNITYIDDNYKIETCSRAYSRYLNKVSDEIKIEFVKSISEHYLTDVQRQVDVLSTVSREGRITDVINVRDELSDRGYVVDSRAIRFIYDRWMLSKNTPIYGDCGIMGILSKHPKWDNKKHMICFDKTWSRGVDEDAIKTFFGWVRSFRHSDSFQKSYSDGLDNPELFPKYNLFEKAVTSFSRTMSRYTSQTLDENVTELLNSMFEDAISKGIIPKFHDGAKTSKVVNKLLSFIPEIKQHDDYNAEFASYGDAINPKTIHRHTVVSLNMLDFLLQSHGNSWRSCHYIAEAGNGRGEYSAGTISYMLDKSSFVVYTVDESYGGDRIELQPKITRCMFAFDGVKLLQQRIYPQATDGSKSVYDEYREFVQGIISECMGVPNFWSVNHDASSYCVEGRGALNYPDWNSQSPDCSSISILKGYESRAFDTLLEIGAKAFHVADVGKVLTNRGHISPSPCGDNVVYDYDEYIDSTCFPAVCVDGLEFLRLLVDKQGFCPQLKELLEGNDLMLDSLDEPDSDSSDTNWLI